MKILGKGKKKIPSKAIDFEALLYKIFQNPQPAAFALIKTAKHYGYFAGENILTKLKPEEITLIKQLDGRLVKQSENYSCSERLKLEEMLPKVLSVKIEKAAYMGINHKTQKQQLALVLVQGGNISQLVEARMFLTLRQRHPKSEWWFASGKNYHKQPIILLENGGFWDDGLLGAISPANMKQEIKIELGNDDFLQESRILSTIDGFFYHQ